MDKNLRSYIKVYNNFLTEDFCQSTVEQLKLLDFETHKFYSSYTDQTTSNEKELAMSFGHIDNKPMLADMIGAGVHQYMMDNNFPWFRNWSGYTHPRWNKYDQNTQMKEHCDHIHSIFDGQNKGVPILSLVGLLNDDFEGGNFVMFQDEVIELKTGDLMIFPSNFLYPHKVTEVTNGTRYSFVSWVW
jgi:predicted 2-oxoglutarate/Fe(II)-dependent dioxygenase YbiX